MTRRLDRAQLLVRQEIVATPRPRACEDRTFELPPVLHIATAALYFGFVSVLSLAFATPGLAVPYMVIAAFIIAFFTVPALWTRMKPGESRSNALRWGEFMESGVATASGRCGGLEATVLVLLLPFLIFCFAIAIVAIANFVS